jgi:flagella basal body P-ring formation protein FlgA
MDVDTQHLRKQLKTGIGRAAALVLLLVLPAVGAAQDHTVIRLGPEAVVNGERILLSQVASITGPDPQLVTRLGKIDLGKAPLPGRKRVIESRHIVMRMNKSTGGLPEEIGLELPRQLEISRKAVRVSKAKIEKIAADWVLERVPWALENVRVVKVQTSSDIVLPQGRLSYRVKSPGTVDFLGTIALSIEFSVDDRPVKRAWVTLNLEVIAPVVVVRRPLGRHQPIDAEDVAVVLRDLTKLPAGVFTDTAEVIGMRARRSLYGSTVLRKDLVEVPPLVKRGDLVTIVAEMGVLRITARGEVKDRGGRGERISVINLDSGKRVYARVLDARTVKVAF